MLVWVEMFVWWICWEGELWCECGLKVLKVYVGGVVVLFDGVFDWMVVEVMKGIFVGVLCDFLLFIKDDEYYWGDLIGLEVINIVDEWLGKVVSLIEMGVNVVLCVVVDDEIECLLFFVLVVVLDVDK